MDIVEFGFSGLNDPWLVLVTIVGVLGMVGFVGGAVMRGRSGPGWDRVILGGAVATAAAFALMLLYTWLAIPR